MVSKKESEQATISPAYPIPEKGLHERVVVTAGYTFLKGFSARRFFDKTHSTLGRVPRKSDDGND